MSKKAEAISIIGGADGPTSIFLAGKGSKGESWIRRAQHTYRNRKYQRKREKAKRLITPGGHFFTETLQYMKEKYGAVEADESYPYYKERKRQMKFSLIQREQPELIGADKQLRCPENLDLQDKEALLAWMEEVDAYTRACEKRAEAIPEEAFPISYHLYVIDCGAEGKIEIETEETRGLMEVNSSGNLKKMQKIVRDIYLYYGVTKEDVENNTDRYRMLVEMCMNKG